MTRKFVTIKMADVKKTINAHFKTKNDLARETGGRIYLNSQEKMKTEMLQVVKLVIAPQIAAGRFNLDLSDPHMEEVLGFKPSRSAQLRKELKAAGITFCPRRSTKPGDYPLWMIKKAFFNYPSFEKKTPAGPYKSNLYNQAYCDLFDQVRAELIADMNDPEYGFNFEDGKWFTITIYMNVNYRIEMMGLSKVDFLK